MWKRQEVQEVLRSEQGYFATATVGEGRPAGSVLSRRCTSCTASGGLRFSRSTVTILIDPPAVQFHSDGSGGKCHGKWNRFWISTGLTVRYPVFVPPGDDGHSWPFPALAGIRPGIYAGFTGGRDPFFVDFAPRCQARLRVSFLLG